MKFEEIYAHMAAEYKTLAGVEPEDAADVSIRLKVLAGELYTVLCTAESLKLNCFPQTAAGEALDLHAEERGLVRKDAVKSVGTLTFSRRTALSYAAEIPAGTVCAASGENAVEYETTEAAVLPAGALTVTAAAQAVLGGRRGNATTGAVNTLITPPAGIESVTNDVPFTGGADKEDDEALRTRLLRCFYALPNGSNTETYRRAALMTPGVKSVQVVPRANGVNTVAVYLYGDNGAVTDEVLGKVGETLEKLKEISVDVTVAAAVAVKKPVTVKIRKGFNEESANAVEIAKILEDCGVAAIAVHGRTRAQFYSGKADWDIIRQVKEAVSIPVIGNGDVVDAASAEALVEQTGCDGIMIGRGAEGNPWIFKQILHYRETGETLAKPTQHEVKEMMLRHARMQVEYKGGAIGIREMRKHVAWYTAGFPHSAKLRAAINQVESLQELEQMLNEWERG